MNMWKRIKDLILKLISVKGIFAILSTVLFFMTPNGETLTAFLAAWGLFILGREVFKLTEIWKK